VAADPTLRPQAVERRLAARRPDPALDALFGPEAHQELRRLAAQGRRRRGGLRVLILAGIMGSTLGRRRAGREDVLWFDPVEIALGRLTHLALPSKRRFEPLGVLLYTYLRLKLSLRAGGFDADFHPYDWRKSVTDAATLLATRIRSEGRPQVHLVAHSMGGLVARALLAHPESAAIGRVVQLGTPNGGAYAALQALRGTYPLVRRLARLDLLHGPEELARKVFVTLPGIAELLPLAADCTSFDPHSANQWPAGPKPSAGLLKAALRARLALPAPDGRFALIAGVGRETITGLRLHEGRLELRRGPEGDGTVPLALARVPGLSTWYSGAEHGRLPGDEQATRATLEILERGATAELPAEWSGARRRARWEPDLAPAVPEPKVFWDDLSWDERREFLHEFDAADEPPALISDAAAAPEPGTASRAPEKGRASRRLAGGGAKPAAALRAPAQAGDAPSRSNRRSATRGGAPADQPARGTKEAQRGRKATSPATILAFATGDIAKTRAEAIVLGLFENVDPAGAALAVDARLGGAIRDLTRRRALATQAGGVFILPAAGSRLPSRHVVFAGLGDFSRYGPEVQRLAAANVTRTLAIAGIRDWALVPWGTASGLEPGPAAAAQLNGILDALVGLRPRDRPQRVTLVSRSAVRLGEARHAMAAVLSEYPRAGLVRLGALPARAARRAAAALPAVTPQSYLFVQEGGGELRVALLGTSAKGTALAATRPLEARELEKHLGSLEEGIGIRSLASFGERLGELLLPEATREALPAVRHAPIVVVHDAPAARWPWETLHVGGWSPAAEAGLSRRYAAEGMSVAKWREERRLDRTLSVLLVVNPTGDLAGAEDEGERVRSLFESLADAELTVLQRGEATRARLLEAFRSGRFDAIHYAGHAYFDSSAPASSGILCAGGRVLSGADLASLDAVPALVCFNACESGRVRRGPQVSRSLGRSTGFAEAFLRGGVASFIGTWWPVSDDAAARFAESLYGALLEGGTVGEAVRAARGAVRASRSGDWANYLHYGSHDFALKQAPRSAGRPPAAPGKAVKRSE
jgi:hypothetical protein